jgi:hypothetical protein
MNLNLTGDSLYHQFAFGFDGVPGSFVGADGSLGEWVECEDGHDFYLDDWHIMRLNTEGDVFASAPQPDRWRLVNFIGASAIEDADE